MTDLAKWKLHGPVKALQSDIAEWDRDRQQWKPARRHARVMFDGRGRITQLDQPGAAGAVHRTKLTGMLTLKACVGTPPSK